MQASSCHPSRRCTARTSPCKNTLQQGKRGVGIAERAHAKFTHTCCWLPSVLRSLSRLLYRGGGLATTGATWPHSKRRLAEQRLQVQPCHTSFRWQCRALCALEGLTPQSAPAHRTERHLGQSRAGIRGSQRTCEKLQPHTVGWISGTQAGRHFGSASTCLTVPPSRKFSWSHAILLPLLPDPPSPAAAPSTSIVGDATDAGHMLPSRGDNPIVTQSRKGQSHARHDAVTLLLEQNVPRCQPPADKACRCPLRC